MGKSSEKLQNFIPKCAPNPKYLGRAIKCLLPIAGWLPKYNLRENLHCDLLTGLTCGVMAVPQGMAYCSLAGVDPVNGLYTCFFSALFYMFFGSCRHISIGTFTNLSLMVGTIVYEFFPITDDQGNSKSPILGDDVTPIMLTSVLTLCVGAIQLLMSVFRLSFLTLYISDPLVSGFTTGAAVHGITSQLDKLIGVKLRHHHGLGSILLIWRDLLSKIPASNLVTVFISGISFIFLIIGGKCINPWFRKRFRVPFPSELLLVVVSVILSSLFKCSCFYGVKIFKHVPSGMPLPAIPRLDLLPYVWAHALPLALIAYIFMVSLEKIFAKKHHYNIRPNQELYALGMCSVLCSLFPVYPFGASIARSSLCELLDAKTLLHALFSSGLLLAVILWIGPFLEPLPMAVLACIVIISLLPMVFQFRALPKLWQTSIFDFLIWLVACLATVLLDITIGFVLSVLFSIFTVVLREQWPSFNEVDNLEENTVGELKKELVKSGAKHIEIWRFESPLHFANVSKFSEKFHQIVQNIAAEPSKGSENVLVLDCSGIAHIDSMGLDSLVEIYKEAKMEGVKLIFIKFAGSILTTLHRSRIIGEIIPESSFYPMPEKMEKY